MILDRLLGDLPAGRFLDEYYFRLPYSRPGGAAGVAPAMDDERVRRLVEAPGADLLLSRRGERAPEGPWRERYREGHTITVRHAERHDEDLARLAAEFHEVFRAPVNVHLYCTPSGEHGFGWHYDLEDVFILQLEGDKAYSLRKNTVNPWPVAATMPRDLRYENEGSPVFECRLRAGDWLYVPPGWWHIARSETESKSLAVGMMSPTALDVLRFLQAELPASVIWRQRLPVSADPDALAKVLRDLGRDLAMAMSDPSLAPKAMNFLRTQR